MSNQEVVTIRGAMSNEAADLSALALRSKAHWGYSPEFMQSCADELTYHPEQIESQQFSFSVAQQGSKIIGFYALETLSPQQLELEALFVDPDHIGQGIGRSLMQHALASAAAQSAEGILIQGDPHAEKFYLAAGAELIGTRASGSIPGRMLPLFEISVHTR